MKVYKLVQSVGYVKNILDHFDILLYNAETEDFITVHNPTIDEYVQLCGRDIIEWMPHEEDDFEGIDILVAQKSQDINFFDQRRRYA